MEQRAPIPVPSEFLNLIRIAHEQAARAHQHAAEAHEGVALWCKRKGFIGLADVHLEAAALDRELSRRERDAAAIYTAPWSESDFGAAPFDESADRGEPTSPLAPPREKL
jgi:hypothetical protein